MLQQFPASLRIMNPVSTLQGAQDSLAAINTTLLPDNSIVMVEASNTLYVLRKSSSAAESSPDIIAPDQGGPGRWYRYGAGGGFFADVVITHTTIPPQTGVDGSATVPGVANDDDVISYNLIDSGMGATLVLNPPRITGANSTAWRVTNVGSETVAPGTISVRVMVSTSP